MNLHPSEIAFLKHLARARDTWVKAAAEGVADPNAVWIDKPEAWSVLAEHLQDPKARAAFVAVASELLSGLVHTTLVSLDGGSELADTTILAIHDQSGHEFKTFLHEFWPEFSDGAA